MKNQVSCLTLLLVLMFGGFFAESRTDAQILRRRCCNPCAVRPVQALLSRVRDRVCCLRSRLQCRRSVICCSQCDGTTCYYLIDDNDGYAYVEYPSTCAASGVCQPCACRIDIEGSRGQKLTRYPSECQLNDPYEMDTLFIDFFTDNEGNPGTPPSGVNAPRAAFLKKETGEPTPFKYKSQAGNSNIWKVTITTDLSQSPMPNTLPPSANHYFITLTIGDIKHVLMAPKTGGDANHRTLTYGNYTLEISYED